MVTQYVTSANRFRIIDRENQEAVMNELDRQKDGIYLNGYMVEQGRALGAKYLIIGHLLNADRGLQYATVQLAVVDVATGESLAVELLSPKGRNASTVTMATEESAEDANASSSASQITKDIVDGLIQIAFNKSLEKNVNDFLDEYFPLQFMITNLEVEEDAVIAVELFGYRFHQFKKNESFRVIEVIYRKNPDGSSGVQKKEIASLKVTSVEGDYAQCKVSKKEQEAFFEKKDIEGLAVIK